MVEDDDSLGSRDGIAEDLRCVCVSNEPAARQRIRTRPCQARHDARIGQHVIIGIESAKPGSRFGVFPLHASQNVLMSASPGGQSVVQLALFAVAGFLGRRHVERGRLAIDLLGDLQDGEGAEAYVLYIRSCENHLLPFDSLVASTEEIPSPTKKLSEASLE